MREGITQKGLIALKDKPRREKKKPKQLREAEKAHDAIVYKEGFDDGFRLGLKEGLKRSVGNESAVYDA